MSNALFPDGFSWRISLVEIFSGVLLAWFWIDAFSAGVTDALQLGVASFLTAAILLAAISENRLQQHVRRASSVREKEAQHRARILQTILEHTGQGIVSVDGMGQVVLLNETAIALLELPSRFAKLPINFDDLVDYMVNRGEYGGTGRSINMATMRQVRSLPVERDGDYYERKRPNGTVLGVRSQKLPGGGFVRTITDITERHRAAEKIVHLASHDPLTNLINRAAFREALDAAIANVEIDEGFSILLADIDDFKLINDAHGQPAGDALLRSMAHRLRGAVRQGDTVARVGGDEFAIILNGLSEPNLVEARARHLVDLLREPYAIGDKCLLATASIGGAVAPLDGGMADALLRHADIALHAAKAEGRNTSRLFSISMTDRLIERRRIEEDLCIARFHTDRQGQRSDHLGSDHRHSVHRSFDHLGPDRAERTMGSRKAGRWAVDWEAI